MRLLICGDRNWNRKDIIILAVANVQTIQWANGDMIHWIIEGEAKGADIMGRVVAQELGISCLSFPAQWDLFGRSAGFIRNKVMLLEGKPDLVLAFHDNIPSSKGTKHMMAIAREAGVPVWLINYKNEWVIGA